MAGATLTSYGGRPRRAGLARPPGGLDGRELAPLPRPEDARHEVRDAEGAAGPLRRAARRASRSSSRGSAPTPRSRRSSTSPAGPGGAGIEEMLAVMPLAPVLAERYRVVGFDQRGTGGSGLLRCPKLERDVRLRSPSAGADCARRLGRSADEVHDAGLRRGPRGDPRRAGRRAADAVRDLLRHRAGARLRPRPSRPRRPDDPRLGRRPRRPRPVRAGRLPRHGARASPGCARAAAAGVSRRPDRRRRRSWPRGCGDTAICAGGPTTAAGRGHRRSVGPTAIADLLYDSDYNPPLRAAMPAAVRAALARRRRAAGAPQRRGRRPGRPPVAEVVLQRPLRDRVRGDAAAVGPATPFEGRLRGGARGAPPSSGRRRSRRSTS